MSTTTPTGFGWVNDPTFIYRGLIVVDSTDHKSSAVYALTVEGQRARIIWLHMRRQELISEWNRVAWLIDKARVAELRAWDGAPWEIHLIQDSAAWYRALEAWSVNR